MEDSKVTSIFIVNVFRVFIQYILMDKKLYMMKVVVPKVLLVLFLIPNLSPIVPVDVLEHILFGNVNFLLLLWMIIKKFYFQLNFTAETNKDLVVLPVSLLPKKTLMILILKFIS